MIKVCKKLGYRNFSQITILFYFENEEFHSGPTGLLSSRKKNVVKKNFPLIRQTTTYIMIAQHNSKTYRWRLMSAFESKFWAFSTGSWISSC